MLVVVYESIFSLDLITRLVEFQFELTKVSARKTKLL